MKKKFRCRHCRRLFPVRVLGQAYCGNANCQKARKNKWRREKYASDLDYRLNQKNSTGEWLSVAGGSAKYHRDYRKRKRRELASDMKTDADLPASTSLFVAASDDVDKSANSDAMIAITPIKTGRYRIFPVFANSDAFDAEIRLITYG